MENFEGVTEKQTIGLILKNIGDDAGNVIPTENENVFTFWNGDEYSGRFSALKDKQKIVMEGKGTYKTGDNQIYEGIWENDGLREADKIVFSDESEFVGTLDDMVIHGPGKYKFKENVEIEGNFYGNGLVGKAVLRDRTDHTWMGAIHDGDQLAISFYPLHSFWQSVLNLPFKCPFYYPDEAEAENEDIFGEINFNFQK